MPSESRVEWIGGICVLTLCEATSRETGRAIGRLLATAGHAGYRSAKNPLVRPLLEALGAPVAADLRRMRIPEPAAEELDGIADGARIPARLVRSGNTIVDLYARRFPLCTSFAVKRGGAWTLGHNTDFRPLWAPVLLRLIGTVVYRHLPRNGMPFLHVSLPFAAGAINGINRAGLALLSHMSVSVPAPRLAAFSPLAFVAREILENASTLAEAEAIARSHAVQLPGNLLVFSAGEERGAVLEMSGERCRRHESLTCTTHFRDPEMAALHRGPTAATRARLERLERLLSGGADPLEILRDQDGPYRHDTSSFTISNGGTFQSFLFEPGERILRISNGRRVPVTRGEYVRVPFGW